MPAKDVIPTIVDKDPSTYEEVHVHAVYNEIASHFSSTRYKPWPIVAKFLSEIPTGWIGLDSGTGNGKYLPLPKEHPGQIWTIGLDKSERLLEFARNKGGPGPVREVVLGDVLDEIWRHGAFDYCISIATIHHLASHDRRRNALKRIIQCLSPRHGRALIYVWAVEQDESSNRRIPSINPDDGLEVDKAARDVFVPWILAERKSTSGRGQQSSFRTGGHSDERRSEGLSGMLNSSTGPSVFNRYYHMFAKGELRELVIEVAQDLGLVIGNPSTERSSGIDIVEEGWERSNYYVQIERWQN